MKFFRRILCMAAAAAVFACAAGAEGQFDMADEGLDLTETVSVHYPVVTGSAEAELLEQVNGEIREQCRIAEYLTRAARLIAGGDLEVEWKAGFLGDVFSCALSAAGNLEDTRVTHAWTAAAVDLRDGHGIAFEELFTDAEAAREKIEAYLEETVAPELSAHLLNSELTPLPESFYLEMTGLTLLYSAAQLSTLSDRAGDIRIPWNVLRDELDLGEDSIPVRMGLRDAVTLTEKGATRLRAAAADGMLTNIPARIGDGMQELTDKYHQLTDWDGIEDGRLFSLEGGCFRGVYLMTDNLTKGWEDSKVQGIRMDQGCLWGLCPGETQRAEWLEVLGEPDGSVEVGEEKAEANRLVPGTCDYYDCGDYLLQLYSDGDGTLFSVILAE